jgi:hypothetical protein
MPQTSRPDRRKIDREALFIAWQLAELRAMAEELRATRPLSGRGAAKVRYYRDRITGKR